MGVCVSCLDGDEYVLLNYPTGKYIEHGPGANCYPMWASSTKHKLPQINNDQYLEVTHLQPDQNGNLLEIVSGPMLYRPTDAYATISNPKQKIRLLIDEYLVVKNIDGAISVIDGPTLYCPIAYQEVSKVKKKINLTVTQYIIVTTETTGQRVVVRGPCLYSPRPMEKIVGPTDMIILNNTDYVYVTHTDTGIIDIVSGPLNYCCGPYDNISPIHQKIVLKNNEYVKIMDQNSGVIRVVSGPATIIPTQYEVVLENIKKTHEINEMRAVYVFDNNNGMYDLITKKGMFTPSPTQEIVEVRNKILLEQNEAVVIIDKEGKYSIINGNDSSSAFFLPPYCKILEQDWTINGEKKKISKFDLRPNYMDYEILVRSKDAVEIFIKLNFYWQIINVGMMISSTHNAPQDVCLHAQSEIISEISRIDIKEFMESFNEVVHKAISEKDDFYDKRGVRLIRVEITNRRCKDPDTEKNFQEIIKKKTDRIKNLEQQHGTNEVKLEEIKGHIEQEKLTGELVNVKNTYLRNEQSKMGEANGSRVNNFIEHLPKELNTDQKMSIYLDQQNSERVKDLTQMHGLNLYLSPNDLDIKMVNLNYNDNDKPSKKSNNPKKLGPVDLKLL